MRLTRCQRLINSAALLVRMGYPVSLSMTVDRGGHCRWQQLKGWPSSSSVVIFVVVFVVIILFIPHCLPMDLLHLFLISTYYLVGGEGMTLHSGIVRVVVVPA